MEFIYIDNSNVFIEGQRASGKAKGMQTLDRGYKIDFGMLYRFATGSAVDIEIGRAALFGSRPPPNDSIWKIAESAGFEVHLQDRNAGNKEKKVDTGIVTMMLTDLYESASPGDRFTLVAGDGDFVPAIKKVREKGHDVDLVFWENVSRELREAASNFSILNLNTLRLLT